MKHCQTFHLAANEQITDVLLKIIILKYNGGGKFHMQILALFLSGVIEFAGIPKNE